jgi:hypothetical protein
MDSFGGLIGVWKPSLANWYMQIHRMEPYVTFFVVPIQSMLCRVRDSIHIPISPSLLGLKGNTLNYGAHIPRIHFLGVYNGVFISL